MVLNTELSFQGRSCWIPLEESDLEAKEHGCMALDIRFVTCECASAETSVRDADLSQRFNRNSEWCWCV